MDTTWSVRIPEELKETLSLLISGSGLNSKDFINQLVQSYALKETARLQPLVNIDVEELIQITSRINNIFLNLFERNNSFQKQREDEFNSQLDEKNGMLAVFNEKIKEHEEKISQYEKEALASKNQYEEICIQHDRLAEIYEANKSLVSEYREKNDTLSGLLTEYKEYKEAINAANAAFDKEKDLRLAVESKLLDTEKNLTTLKKCMEEEKVTHEIKFQRDIERIELQHERHILEIKKDYQQKMQSEQEMYSEKVRELLCAIEEIQRPKPSKKSGGVNANIINPK